MNSSFFGYGRLLFFGLFFTVVCVCVWSHFEAKNVVYYPATSKYINTASRFFPEEVLVSTRPSTQSLLLASSNTSTVNYKPGTNSDPYLEDRFAGLLSHVYWLISQVDDGVGNFSLTTIPGRVDTIFLDKQIERTTDSLNDSIRDQRVSLDDGLTELGTRISQAEASLADILSGSTSLPVASNIILGNHWLSGDGDNEGLSVDTNGNVGIGTSTPAVKLHVTGNGSHQGIMVETTSGHSPFLDLSYNAGAVQTRLQSNATNGWVGTLTNHDFRLITSGTDRVRITAGGNVGIGTTTPTQTLDVVGNIRVTGSVYFGNNIAQSIGADSDSLYLGSNSHTYSAIGGIYKSVLNANGLSINNGGTGAASGVGLVVASGNVGIGTIDPLGKLNLENGALYVGNEADTSQTNILLNGYGHRVGSTLYGNVGIRSTYENFGNSGSLDFYTATGGTNTEERMRIMGDGNIGIGTSVPRVKLDVSGTIVSNNGNVIAQGISHTGMTGRGMQMAFSGGVGYLQAYDYDSPDYLPMSFGDNFMNITSGGNVGIGTTTPISKLTINGDLSLSIQGTSTANQSVGTLVWNGNSIYAKLAVATTSFNGWYNLASDNSVDVFLVAGQSNAVGIGVAVASPQVPSGKVLQYYNGTISDANDPVGNADTGGAWPAFGTAYYNATGRKVLFVPAAVSGTSQVATADVGNGNWDASGALYNNSVTAVNNALSAISARGLTPVFKGVLWHQGESDGIAINSATITKTDYRNAFLALISRYRTDFGPTIPLYIFRIGRLATGSDVGLSQIREAQEEVAGNDFYTHIVFRNAVDFLARGLMSDEYHYTQAGYNEMGTIGASNVISAQGDNTFFQVVATSTRDLYYREGRLSIGTTTPGSMLSVVGLGTLNPFSVASSSGSSLFTVLSGGSVGIGTSTPTNKLTIHTSDDTAQIKLTSPGGFGLPAYMMSVLGDGFIAGSGGYFNGTNWVAEGTGAGYVLASLNSTGFYGDTGLTPGNSFTPTSRLFISNATGHTGIGTTTPAERLTVDGTIKATNLLGGSTNLTTDASGNIIREGSDRRLKENITTIDNALETLLGLRGVRYEWIDKERFGEQYEIGFIAQEVDVLVPEVVQKGGEYWSLNTKNLLAVVVEAMKEMWTKMLVHEERLTELEIENSILKTRLQAVEAELKVDVDVDFNENQSLPSDFTPDSETDSDHGLDSLDVPEVINKTDLLPLLETTSDTEASLEF